MIKFFRFGRKYFSSDISNYYLLNKIFFKKYGIATFTIVSFYFLNRKYQYWQKFKNNFIIQPILEILNSKEVKGAGVNLIEDLFKDKRVLQTILISLKLSIKEKEFEDPLKVFIKQWVLKVLKHPEFLQTTKRSVIEMLKSKIVIDETVVLLKYLAESNATKDSVAEFFKILFLSDDVFPEFCDMFEKSSLNAIKSQKNKTNSALFLNDLYNDKKFRYFIYYKTLAFNK